MAISKLDHVENLSPQFNVSADVALEKSVVQYQLTKEEQHERFALQKQYAERTQQEKDSFSKPEEYHRRVKEKYAELAKGNVPEAKPAPSGTVTTLTLDELLKKAHVEVQQDHGNRVNGYNTEYHNGITAILNRARENGRGPKLEEEQRRAAFMERRQHQRRQEQDRRHDRER